MISLEETPKDNKIQECVSCKGSGKIEVYRGDWEDYDEVNCSCNLK
jgi:hypothetical protein